MTFCYCADMERRDLSHKEKLYLREQNVITETQCTLGKSIILDTKCFKNLQLRYNRLCEGVVFFQVSQLCGVMK